MPPPPPPVRRRSRRLRSVGSGHLTRLPPTDSTHAKCEGVCNSAQSATTASNRGGGAYRVGRDVSIFFRFDWLARRSMQTVDAPAVRCPLGTIFDFSNLGVSSIEGRISVPSPRQLKVPISLLNFPKFQLKNVNNTQGSLTKVVYETCLLPTQSSAKI
jgi:hypothetical protein